MANSLPDSDAIDHLPDALLVTILSFIPTHIAACTSVLSRRFRHLWEASPSLALISRELLHEQDMNFVAMANRALLSRNPSDPLLSLRLEVSRCCDRNASFLSSLLAKARSFDLCHLTIEGFQFPDFLPILPIIITINSLRLTCPFSTQLSLNCVRWKVYIFIYKFMSRLSLSSKTITKLKLDITFFSLQHTIVDLSLPSLESLHLEIKDILPCLYIRGEVPLLGKAVIKLHKIYERDVSLVAGMLNFISHVEELSLHLKESKLEKYPIPILLESGKDVSEFHKLEHLDLTFAFTSTIFKLSSPCSVPEFTGFASGRKRRHWRSRLPCSTDNNCRYAYFNNLHLEESREQVIKLLSKKCSS